MKKEDLKDILWEFAKQIDEVSPGLPIGWLLKMTRLIENL